MHCHSKWKLRNDSPSRHNRSSVPTGALSSNLGVARGSYEVGNVGIFGDFVGFLPFPKFYPLTIPHCIFPNSISFPFS